MRKKTSVMYVGAKPQVEVGDKLVGYDCGGCRDITVVSSNVRSPYCSHCGSGNMEKASRNTWKKSAKSLRKTAFNDSEEMLGVECAKCLSFLMLNEDTAKTHIVVASYDDAEHMVGRLHCPVCSTEIGMDVAGLFGANEQDNTLGDDDLKNELLDDNDEEDAQWEASEQSPGENDDVNPVVVAPKETEETPAQDVLPKVKTKSTKKTKKPVAAKPPEEAPAEEEQTAGPLDTQWATLPLAKYASGCVNFVRSKDKLFAMMDDDGNHVCVGVKDVTGRDTHQMENALHIACQGGQSEVEKVLANNGFALSSINVGYDRWLAEEVDKRDAVMRSQYKEKMESLGGALGQSVAIAMCGINKGYFKDVTENPIVASMAEKLSTRGMMNEHEAREIIASAMQEASDPFVSLVRNKTLEMLDKPEETRNEMAEVLKSLNERPGVDRYMSRSTQTAAPTATLPQRLKEGIRPVTVETAAARKTSGGRNTLVDRILDSDPNAGRFRIN